MAAKQKHAMSCIRQYMDLLVASDTTDRIPPTLLVVAHPDDEIIAVGARISRFAELTIVHLTDGVPRDPRFAVAAGFQSREQYRTARQQELEQAFRHCTGAPIERKAFGFTDQEVIYSIRPCICLLSAVIRQKRPVAVLTHSYEGGHPDHDAAAYCVTKAVRMACWNTLYKPLTIEFPCYHDRDGVPVAEQFLPSCRKIRHAPLNEKEKNQKRILFDCFPSQRQILSLFPLENESYRFMPKYDFSVPPHGGRLFYERMRWNIDGVQWRQLAAESGKELRIGGSNGVSWH